MNLRPKRKISAEFSMSSMTDLIFLLLIFFIIASTFISPNAIAVNLPNKTNHRDTPITVAVAVDKDGSFWVNNKKTSLDDLPSAIQEVLTKKNTTNSDNVSIALYGDIEAKYEDIFNVIKIGKAMDLKVLLATDADN